MIELSLILLIDFALAISVAFGIGAGNESMAPLAGSGITSVRTATFLAAILAFLGAIVLGHSVEGTIGRDLLTDNVALFDVFVIMFSMAVWSIFASYRGWPVSTTHSSIGAAIGLGLIKWGPNSVNWLVLASMAVTWILSPLIALFGAVIILKIIRRLLRFYADGLLGEMRIARLSAIPLLLCSGIFTFSAGANDIGKASAFLSIIYGDSFLVRVIIGLGLLVGSLTLGRRVTRSIGLRLVRLDPVMALSAETTMALIMFIGTILGLPLSGTHILVGAVIGVGSSRGRWINIKGLKQIIFSWLATFFVATLICVVVFFVARTVF